MITKIAVFKVKKDKLSVCKKAIKEFVEKVRENEPETLVYESYQKYDKVSFLHLMSFKDKKAEVFHRNTDWVKKFVDTLYPNCEEEPEFFELNLVASNKQ